MTARYTVVQYLPDPVTDERINVGVITWDDERVCSRFLADWRRVQAFGGESPSFLQDFAKKFEMLTSPQLRMALGEENTLDARRLAAMIGSWSHSIQFAAPRGSIKDAGALLTELVQTFLRQPEAKPQSLKRRNRRAAATLAVKFIFDALARKVPDRADDMLKKNEMLSGVYENHEFDVVVKNARPLAAVHAMSFETHEGGRLEREVDATAWMLEDVGRKHKSLPMAVFLLPPIGPSLSYERAKGLFPRLRGEIVPEGKMQQWARQKAQAIAGHVR